MTDKWRKEAIDRINADFNRSADTHLTRVPLPDSLGIDHLVNALFMSPGGYHNADYIRAGGIMSLVFLVLAVGTVWLLFV